MNQEHQLRFIHRQVDDRASAIESFGGQRRADGERQEDPADDIRLRHADTGRPGVLRAGDAHDAANCLDYYVEGRPIAQRAGLAESSARGVTMAGLTERTASAPRPTLAIIPA